MSVGVGERAAALIVLERLTGDDRLGHVHTVVQRPSFRVIYLASFKLSLLLFTRLCAHCLLAVLAEVLENLLYICLVVGKQRGGREGGRTFISAPAHHARPAPVTMITRTSGSAVARSYASYQAVPRSSPQPFIRWGLLRVMTHTPSERPRIFSYSTTPPPSSVSTPPCRGMGCWIRGFKAVLTQTHDTGWRQQKTNSAGRRVSPAGRRCCTGLQMSCGSVSLRAQLLATEASLLEALAAVKCASVLRERSLDDMHLVLAAW